MLFSTLADAVAVVHFAFLAFVVVGGFLAWRWPWVIWAHLAAAGWGALITVFSINCPLTHVENSLRGRAGEGELDGGFIDTYVEGVLYPERYVDQARLLAALVVLASWIGLARRHRRARGQGRARAEHPLVQGHRDG